MTKGFTLLELLVVALLLALIAGIGLVSLDGLTARNRLEASGRCIEQAFRLARSEAIASGLPRRLLLDPPAHAALLQRPRIDQQGLTWTAGPRLAWSEYVELLVDENLPAVTAAAADGHKQMLLCVWPDGTGPACQLQLKEAGQQVTVTIDGWNASSQWSSTDANGKTTTGQP